MKKLLLLVVLGGSILMNGLFAEDKVEGEKPKEDKPKTEKPKPVIKELDLTGTITTHEINTKDKEGKEVKKTVYHLKTKENILVNLPNFIGKEDAKLDQYLNKTVAVKAKCFEETRKKSDGKEYTSIRVIQLLSVTPAEEAKPSETKPAEEKKAEEAKPEEKKAEENKPAEGGMK